MVLWDEATPTRASLKIASEVTLALAKSVNNLQALVLIFSEMVLTVWPLQMKYQHRF